MAAWPTSPWWTRRFSRSEKIPGNRPVHAALAVAEGRARFRMRHSKTAYPVPPKLAAGSRLSSLLAGPTAYEMSGIG